MLLTLNGLCLYAPLTNWEGTVPVPLHHISRSSKHRLVP